MTALSPGRVVILNGTSSSGKSTIVSMFIEQRGANGEWWLPVATDDFQMKLVREWAGDGPFGEDGMRFVQEPFGIRVHIGKRGRRLQAAYHRTVAVCAREGSTSSSTRFVSTRRRSRTGERRSSDST